MSYLFANSFIHRFIDLLIYRFTDLLIYSCIDLSIYMFIDLLIYRFIYLLVDKFIIFHQVSPRPTISPLHFFVMVSNCTALLLLFVNLRLIHPPTKQILFPNKATKLYQFLHKASIPHEIVLISPKGSAISFNVFPSL